MAFNISLKDFEPDSFVLKDYVEKLAKMDPSTGIVSQNVSERRPFDPVVLLNTFKESIAALKEMSNRNQRRVDKLEQVCSQQEREHEARIRDLDHRYTEAFEDFQELEDRITLVATKVVHLGDQLESSNNRRARDSEAETLMKYLAEFHSGPKPVSHIFSDPGQLPQAADVICKLNMLASELPLDKYKEVKIRISEKYVQIESALNAEFNEAHVSADIKRMKMYASALQQFSKGYSKCIDSFITQSIQKISTSQAASTDHVFLEVDKHCAKVRDQIEAVFETPEMVTARFVQAVFEKVLSKHISSTLDDLIEQKKTSEYLKQLHELFTKTARLASKLSRSEMSSDPAFLSKLTKMTLFNKYLSFYSTSEVEHLQKRCNAMLTQYYESLGIPRRSQGGLRSRTIKVCPDETYISDDVCSSIIYESKRAVNRCKELISDRELSDTVTQIYDTVMDVLCADHFDYALDIVFTSIPSSQPHSPPSGQFFQVVGMINSHVPLIENLFREVIAPCIKHPQVASSCLETKRKVIAGIEQKVELGIVRCLNSMLNWVKRLLSSQQKSDFRPEEGKSDEIASTTNSTNACSEVVQYMCECYKVIDNSLDGKNREAVLIEFGTRLHRTIYEHIQQFTFNSAGGMLAICDMNAYRKAIKLFDNKLLDQLFENLQSLCNIFIITPEHVKQVCSEEPLVGFDRTVLMTMMQLRADYRKTKQFTL